jgi:hypothetical protein
MMKFEKTPLPTAYIIPHGSRTTAKEPGQISCPGADFARLEYWDELPYFEAYLLEEKTYEEPWETVR